MATEKRLIDANVVLAKKFTTGLSDASGNYYGYADVVFADDIENAPTVDAVEVVRCKDCKYYYKDKIKGFICRHPELDYDIECYDHWINANPDDFCSCGERKGGGSDG